MHKGYLYLPSTWLAEHHEFQIRFPMTIRTISPHPYTNQRVVALTRGPIIYCIEDVDQPWVQDHFKVCLARRPTYSQKKSLGIIPPDLSTVRYFRYEGPTHGGNL
jgi:DUF1680 family protein